MMRSRRIIARFSPHIAIGVGGYASGPILKAASRKGIPLLIQEQNSYAGVTNRLLARAARSICVAYENMERYFPEDRIVLTGNPVRQNLLEIRAGSAEGYKKFEIKKGKKVCLVVGGSLGARTLNQSFMEGLGKLDREELVVLWQCGKYYHAELEEKVKASGLKNIRLMPFISRMDLAYGVADIIVSRAGALSISELCIVGKPVILVPSPNVAEDHQTHNAKSLERKNAALMIPDVDAREQLVDRMLKLMEDEMEKENLAKNVKQLGIVDASQRIAAEVQTILTEQ